MNSHVVDITLGDIEDLTAILVCQMRSSHFEPDLVIYLETGARLLAARFHAMTGVATISLTIQRSGNATKSHIASLLCILPRFVQNFLRQMERQLATRRSNTHRKIAAAPEIDLFGKKVLILDDAADSGQSLILAKQWILERGGIEPEIKLATIAVTQPNAKEIVDFWVYSQLCRFPWSSDSQEREEYLKLYEQIDPTKLAAGTL